MNSYYAAQIAKKKSIPFPYVKIGDQFWSRKNLDITSINGITIPEVQGASTAVNTELVTGGNFEGGLIGAKSDSDSGGVVSTWSLNTSNPISGTQDGRLVVTTIGSGGNSVYRPLIQVPMPMKQNQRYIIKFDYKVNSGTVVWSGISLGGGANSLTSITLSGAGTTQREFTISGTPALSLTLYFNGTNLFDLQIDNISIKEVGWAALTTPAWCYYDNDPLNGAVYGKEYNLYGAQAINANAPTGYTIGTYVQWLQMVTLLGGTSVAGNKMKLNGTALWAIGNAGTNESGFTALPNGQRNSDGAFSQINNKANFWTSDGFLVTLDYNAATVTFTPGADAKIGASVRLLRNEP